MNKNLATKHKEALLQTIIQLQRSYIFRQISRNKKIINIHLYLYDLVCHIVFFNYHWFSLLLILQFDLLYLIYLSLSYFFKSSYALVNKHLLKCFFKIYFFTSGRWKWRIWLWSFRISIHNILSYLLYPFVLRSCSFAFFIKVDWFLFVSIFLYSDFN